MRSATLWGRIARSGGWWERAGWATEEWDVETEGGGLYRLAHNGDEWRIEGSYNEPPAEHRPGSQAVVPMPPQET